MPSIFAYQSAEVDWCEENFKHSEYIAEYYNTVSNIAFFIFPPLMLWLNTQYNSYRSAPLRCFVIIEMIIGVFSVYFHSTLSYAGQMLDELSIMWAFGTCYAFWLPSHHLPGFIKNRDQFIWMVAIVTIFITLMSFLKPTLNAYVLNTFIFHFLYLTFQEVKTNRKRFPYLHRMALTMTGWWTIAIVCWIVDRFLCEFCHKINFRYLHSLWHIFILIAVHHAVTLITFCDVFYDLSCSELEVVYWPRNFGPLALPYVVFQRSNKSY
ncbi:alkaline ceramidase 1-like [Hemicordylus capensis]|uniref:alkaline ceramidase 1-like n=1 Tax=Hemicordylus capensis TaxID=884348 RepID=UPI00230265FD|nr:alkaline ceramidase 1-like [Hemicordylus capensis]